jgi:quercetin dioxygenase-like cupin family protein
MIDLKDVESKDIAPGCSAKFVNGESMTCMYWDEFKAGVQLPEHSHPNEQITTVLSGELEIDVDGKVETLSADCVLVIAPNVRHSAKAVTDCRAIDAFYPIREPIDLSDQA